MRFDIDALFDHMINNLGHDINDEQDWTFSLRSGDLEALKEVAEELANEFMVQLQETVEEVDSDGNRSYGEPLLSIVRRGALRPDQLREIAERIGTIAAQRGLAYDGVSCYDPIDEEEVFGWLQPDDAQWRLRHMTDCGLEENAELPWAFLVVTPDLPCTEAIAAELTKNGFHDHDDYDEPDEEGNLGLCVFVAGRNNEWELSETCKRIMGIVERHGGRLKGVQFYSRDDMNEDAGPNDVD